MEHAKYNDIIVYYNNISIVAIEKISVDTISGSLIEFKEGDFGSYAFEVVKIKNAAGKCKCGSSFAVVPKKK